MNIREQREFSDIKARLSEVEERLAAIVDIVNSPIERHEPTQAKKRGRPPKQKQESYGGTA